VLGVKARAIVGHALFVAFLGWLYGGDLVRFVQAQRSPVSALPVVPSIGLALLGLVATIALAVTVVLSVVQQRPASWRGRRLALLGAATLVLVDLGLIASRRTPIAVEESLALAVQGFAEAASEASAPEVVARDPQLLEGLLTTSPVPLFVGGERVPRWRLEVRERCAGPATEVGRATPGTLVYCVASDYRRAWVTLVATAGAQPFGEAAIVGADGPWLGDVHGLEPEPRDEEPPVWPSPTPEDAP
jgi:hypothetical protein